MQRIECVYLFCPLVLKSLVTRVHTPKCGRESQSQSESSNYTIRDSTSSQCEVQQLPTKLLSKRCPPKKINNQKISLKKSFPPHLRLINEIKERCYGFRIFWSFGIKSAMIFFRCPPWGNISREPWARAGSAPAQRRGQGRGRGMNPELWAWLCTWYPDLVSAAHSAQSFILITFWHHIITRHITSHHRKHQREGNGPSGHGLFRQRMKMIFMN